MSARIDWTQVLREGKAIIAGSETRMTLRQLHYRLVSTGAIPNTINAYKALSKSTAQARRDGQFPALLDQTRGIEGGSWRSGSLASALKEAASLYSIPHTDGQPYQVVIGAEKATMLEQLRTWFGRHEFPIVVCKGFASQTLADSVGRLIANSNRPNILIDGGDLDPSGKDILRDLLDRTGRDHWAAVEEIAVTPAQIDRYGLVPMPGKVADSRAAGFVQTYGRLYQIEVEALHPDDLRDIYQTAVDRYWDKSAYDAVVAQEQQGRERLLAFAGTFNEIEDGR